MVTPRTPASHKIFFVWSSFLGVMTHTRSFIKILFNEFGLARAGGNLQVLFPGLDLVDHVNGLKRFLLLRIGGVHVFLELDNGLVPPAFIAVNLAQMEMNFIQILV